MRRSMRAQSETLAQMVFDVFGKARWRKDAKQWAAVRHKIAGAPLQFDLQIVLVREVHYLPIVHVLQIAVAFCGDLARSFPVGFVG